MQKGKTLNLLNDTQKVIQGENSLNVKINKIKMNTEK